MLKNFTATLMTVHKSKGLKVDIVVVLHCNSGEFGFPTELSDDPVLDLLLSDADRFENGGERRLFYVAITRAREYIYFVASSNYKSKFITEIETKGSQLNSKKCPKCRTADVVLKKRTVAVNGNIREFYGCSNFLFGCNYNQIEWINKNKPQFKRQ